MGLSGIGGSFGTGFNKDSGDSDLGLNINPLDFSKELDMAIDKAGSTLGVAATESVENPPVQVGNFEKVTREQEALYKKAKRTDSPPFKKFESLSQGISQN